MSVDEIKKALEGVTQEEAIDFINTAMRNWNRLPKLDADDLRDLAEELQRFSERRYASTLESLQRENEELRERLDIGPCGEDAIDVAESAAGFLRHRMEVAEAGVKRLREALSIINAGHGCPMAVAEDALRSQALASTGGEHHAE